MLLGYIIKEEGISICMSSKHLQTRRLLSTLQAYLLEVRGMLVQLWREANERPTEAFMDHTGVLRDARTGSAIGNEEEGKDDREEMREYPTQFSYVDFTVGSFSCGVDDYVLVGGFGFFDVGTQEVAPQARRRRPHQVGEYIQCG